LSGGDARTLADDLQDRLAVGAPGRAARSAAGVRRARRGAATRRRRAVGLLAGQRGEHGLELLLLLDQGCQLLEPPFDITLNLRDEVSHIRNPSIRDPGSARLASN